MFDLGPLGGSGNDSLLLAWGGDKGELFLDKEIQICIYCMEYGGRRTEDGVCMRDCARDYMKGDGDLQCGVGDLKFDCCMWFVDIRNIIHWLYSRVRKDSGKR